MSMIKRYIEDNAIITINSYRKKDITKLSDSEAFELCTMLAYVAEYDEPEFLIDILKDAASDPVLDGVTELNYFINIALEKDF